MPYPFLKLDSKIAKENIRKMAEKAAENKVEFRPHFKTHQSKKIGRWFKELNVQGITVSSVGMAEYFAEDGWSDITIAFPVNVLEIDRINQLAAKIQLRILVIDTEVISFLDAQLQHSIRVYIELDPKYGRSGIDMDDKSKIAAITNAVQRSKKMHFEGFYAHAGHTYKLRAEEDVLELARSVLTSLGRIKQTFGGKICFGDTPSCSLLPSFDNVDQISPGNFVFYDWMQTQIGACSPKEIAVTMHVPVISKFEQRSEVLIHGGAVHFSKEFILNERTPVYGIPANTDLGSTYLKSLSQEHGIIHCSEDTYRQYKIGDLVPIYPIHSCLTANLMRKYVDEIGEVYDHFGSILLD